MKEGEKVINGLANIVILTPITMLAEGLKTGLTSRESIASVTIVDTLAKLQELLAIQSTATVLIDVTQEVDINELRALAVSTPKAMFWALGLEHDLVKLRQWGSGVFAGYLSRSASFQELYQIILNPVDTQSLQSSVDAEPALSGFSAATFFSRIFPFGSKK